jgi:hypothetical protein
MKKRIPRKSVAGGQPRVLCGPDGRTIPMPVFDCVDDQTEHPELIRTLARNGMGTFSARSRLAIGPAEETASIAAIVAKMDAIAANAPEARLLLSLNLTPGASWRRAHPSELTVSRDGRYPLQGAHPGFRRGEVDEARFWEDAEISVFSAVETRAYAAAIGRLFAELLARPYGNRLVGAFLHKYIYGEWSVPHWYPDWSPPARRTVAQFLRRKYRTDAALRAAWAEPAATLSRPAYPTRESVYHRLDVGMLKLETQAMRDYLEAEAHALAKKFHDCCRAVKRVNPGFIAGGFFGYGHPYQSEIRSVLGDGAIDFLCTPMEYSNREPGGGVSTQSPYADMPALHGAVFFDELDTATHTSPEVMNNVGRPRNRREARGVLWRDVGTMIVNGHAGWYLDFAGHPGHASCGPHRDRFPRHAPSWHLDPPVLAIHRRIRRLWERIDSFDRSSVAGVRVFYPQQNNRIAALGDHKRIEFPMAGLPLEEYALADLLDGSVAPGKLNLLFWPVLLGAAERRALADLLDRSPADWVVYGPAGLVDAERTGLPAVERVEQVTGFALDFEWLEAPRALRVVPTGRLAASPLRILPTFGQSHKVYRSMNISCLPGEVELRRKPRPVGEVELKYRLCVREGRGIEVLAGYDTDRRPGFAVRTNRRGGRIYFYPLPEFNSELFRILLDWAGGHLYIREDAYLAARRGLVLLHQARAGEYALELPEKPRAAFDLCRGKPVALSGSTLHLSGSLGTTHLIETQ